MIFNLLGKYGRFGITLWPFWYVAVVDVHVSYEGDGWFAALLKCRCLASQELTCTRH